MNTESLVFGDLVKSLAGEGSKERELSSSRRNLFANKRMSTGSKKNLMPQTTHKKIANQAIKKAREESRSKRKEQQQ